MTMMTVETPEKKKPWNKNVLKSKMLIHAAAKKITNTMNPGNAVVRKKNIKSAAAV
ncbi:hypothetical protein [Rossellomorea aquimaris]|uniref:hypothetical protein n=1 Tax=Rossellomorea aquimaris TaxID=189382 RepID=UPI000A9FDD5C|nr:hypothetical protein [Rossellomorea aquimaris]